MKLKWYLKGLCILGLTLLPITFSNGFTATLYDDHISPWDSLMKNTILPGGVVFSRDALNTTLNQSWSFVYGSKNVSNLGLVNNYFFRDVGSDPYFVIGQNASACDPIKKQGVSKYFYLCDSLVNTGSTPTNCTRQDYVHGSLDQFMASLTVDDLYFADTNGLFYYNGCGGYGYDRLCFSSSAMGKSVCFNECVCAGITCNYNVGEYYNFCYQRNTLNNDDDHTLDISYSKRPWEINSLNFGNPPGYGVVYTGINDTSDVIYYSDNNQIYRDFFDFLGYNTGLCYSDFALTDIVITDGSYYQFFPSEINTGASIFDLHDHWFSSLQWSAWYSNMKGYYNTVGNRDDYFLYMGKSKGYYRLIYKVENSNDFIDTYKPSGNDLALYCNMVINGYDPDAMFTGSLSVNSQELFINSNFRNGYTRNGDGTFILNGSNSAFSGEVDLNGLFNRLYTTFKTSVTVDKRFYGTVGILPTWIIFGFFIFVLLYLFKR